jgi:ABC-type transport system involved in multi-copper enzyme maturation permease subunit
MFKLINLEMKKVSLDRYVYGAIIASIIMTGFLFFMLYIDRYQYPPDVEDFFFLVDSTRMIFIVFSGVLISKLVIEEYKDKTISLMFTYPISRKKIIISKLMIIIIFTFFSMLLSRLFVAVVLYVLNNNLEFIDGDVTIHTILIHFRDTILYDLSVSGISLVPLFFGMLRKSVRTTIVSSIIIAAFLGISIGQLSIASYIVIPLTLSVIGVVASYLTIRNIEHTDIT